MDPFKKISQGGNGKDPEQSDPDEDDFSYLPGVQDFERSESGSPILRYKEPDIPEEYRAPQQDDEALTLLDEHISRHLAAGPDDGFVFHEIISDLVHIDVHVIPPSPKRNYYTLITTGMSDLPMHVPPEAEDQRYAELMICLPPDWPLNTEPGQAPTGEDEDDAGWWPVSNLKFLARFPHEYQTWLGRGHSVPNGDPPEPFAPDVGFCGVVLAPPLLFGEEFCRVDVRQGKSVQILAMVPLYESEMNFKLKYGFDALAERFDEHGVTELLDLRRPNVCPD